MSKKKHPQDEPSGNDPAFSTRPMQGPDGEPLTPPEPGSDDSAFDTLIVPSAADLDRPYDQASFRSMRSGNFDDIPAAGTQQMTGPDGVPLKPPHPEINDPAFATQIVGPESDADSTDPDVLLRGEPLPPEESLSQLSQTIPATGKHMAELAGAAKTQRQIVTIPDKKTIVGIRQSESEKPATGRSTWNLRIRQRGIDGHVSGIINRIPADPSARSGLQSALVSDESDPEYEVVDEIGAGNMGVVYRARQTSLNRMLAIKSLKPTSRNSDHDQAMFVSEAVVTANLVHPNIVPIHDLGRTDDGKLFYTMKQVSGTPWNTTIRKNSLEENLDIFMKMCDAVAYAHSKGVINRDLKPENVVVGEYGEVNVLDWGLAITTEDFEQKNSVFVEFRGGGGTPVYMAPELASEDVSVIGTYSDIYLLGAILFEILEGFPPHLLRESWKTEDPQDQLRSVILAVLNNRIETNVVNEGELMEIARKAMQTDPADRWATVEEFQEAIREYRITGRAEELMREVAEEGASTYSRYQSAVALYGDALRKWPDNHRALDGDRKARLAYARLAHAKGDIDLGLQVLPANDDPEFKQIRAKLNRTRHARQIVRTTWMMLFVAAVGLSGWLVYKNEELLNAEAALVRKTTEAQEQTEIANKAERAAETARQAAERERLLAENARQEARAQTELANQAREDVLRLSKDVEVARQEVETQKTAAINARKQADAARRTAMEQEKQAMIARRLAEQQKALAEEATAQAETQEKLARMASEEARQQTLLAEAAKQEADSQSQLAQRQTELAKAAELEKTRALREAEKTRIEGRLEQVDAKMEIRKYDDVVELVDRALTEFESIADQPDLIELLEKKKQEAQRRTGNTATRLDGKNERAATSPDGKTLVVSAQTDVPTVTIFRDVGDQALSEAQGIVVQPRGRTVRDVSVSNDGQVLSVTGRCLESRNFYHQLWTWSGSDYKQIAYSESPTRRPPACLLSADGRHAYLLTSGRTGTLRVYDVTAEDLQLVVEQELDESTGTFPAIRDAVLLPDESAVIVATNEGCRSIAFQWSDGEVQVVHRKQGQAFNNVFPAPRGLNRLGIGGEKDRFDPRQLALSADGSTLALISGTRLIVLPRRRRSAPGAFPFTSPDQLAGNGVVDTSYGTRISASFSADGSRLVTAGRRYIQLWEQNGQSWQLSSIDDLYDDSSIAGHSRSVEHVSFIADDAGRLVSVSGDGVVRTWNPSTYADYIEGMQELVDVLRDGAFTVLSADDEPVDAALLQQHQDQDRNTAARRQPDDREVTRNRSRLTPASERPSSWLLTAAGPPAAKPRRVRQARRVFSAEFSRDSERIVVGANDLAAHTFDSRTANRTASQSTPFPRDPFFAPDRNNFLEGHIPEIVSVRFLPPNGELLLTLDYFGSISVWDASDDADGIGFEKSRPRPRQPLQSDEANEPYEVDDPSCEIAVSRSGDWIMAAGVRNDGNPDVRASTDEYFVAVWKTEQLIDVAAPQPYRVLTDAHSSRITAAAFSPQGSLALTAGRRGRLVLWDFEQDRILLSKDDTHNSDGVSGVFFVSESEFISAGFDGRVYRWTIGPDGLSETIIPRGDTEEDPDFIVRLRPSTDGTRFITSDLTKSSNGTSYNLKLNVWSSTDGWQATLPMGFISPPTDLGRSYRHDVSWSPDGSRVLYVHDETLLIYDTTEWKAEEGFRLPEDTRAVRGAFAPAVGPASRIATFDGRFAHLWNVNSGEHIAEFRSHGPFVRAGYSFDRRYLITGSESIRVFHADEQSPDHGRPVFRLSRRTTGRSVFASAKFSPAQNDYRFASIDRTGTVRLWNWEAGAGPPEEAAFEARGSDDMRAEYSLPNAVCWSDDAQYLAAVQLGQVMLWRLEDGQPRPIPVRYPRGIAPVDLIMNDVDFSSDGIHLTAGGSFEDESYALVWSIDGEEAVPAGEIDAEEYHSSYEDNADGLTGITCIGFDEGRREIITGGADSRVLRWQLRQPDPGEVADLPYIASMVGGPQDTFRTPHTAAVSDLDIAGSGSILTADDAGYFVIWPASR